MKNKEISNWQTQLSQLISDINKIIPAEKRTSNETKPLLRASQLFKLKIPQDFYAYHAKKNNSAVLTQFLPHEMELNNDQGYAEDPLQERKVNPVPGLLHKYSNRVLVTLSSACAIHCRYCFRRNFPYAENNPGTEGWKNIFNYIKTYPEINEVILSGGDPLTLKDETLISFTNGLSLLTQIKRLRIHTRVPVVLPERITLSLLNWLKSLHWDVIIVLHVNHPDELTPIVKRVLKKLRKAKVYLLNQSVLLKGVNDSASVLSELSEKLFSYQVLPYYLHLLDRVKGASHFAIPDGDALAIYEQLSHQLPGYLLPKLVREEPGKKSKTVIFP